MKTTSQKGTFKKKNNNFFFLFKKEEKLTLSVLMFTFRPFVLFLSAGGVEGPVFTQSSIDGDQYFDIFRYIDALTRLK